MPRDRMSLVFVLVPFLACIYFGSYEHTAVHSVAAADRQRRAVGDAVAGYSPGIFFSDLTSGPATGGQDGKGAFVTIWGSNFGNVRGSSNVFIGSAEAANYLVWTDGKITFQIGTAAVSGNIVVRTAVGTSNGVLFTVRPGNIFFVSVDGNDGDSGDYVAPFRTVPHCKASMSAGDICYVEDGVEQDSIDDYGAGLSIQSGGTAAMPIALIAYPGASVTIGRNDLAYALRTPAINGDKSHWIISQVRFLSGGAAIDLVNVDGWKIVGNELTCPAGSGQSACFHTDTTTNLQFWGNYVHDVGTTSGSIDKYYHAVYFTTNSNHIDVGWNTIVPNPHKTTLAGACRAIQFYSTGGSDQFDLHVHDNVIHDVICDGINFSTVNPDLGPVEAFNNVIYRAGTGPDPANGASNYACISTASSSTAHASVEVYNNTLFDCGAQGSNDAGAFTLYTPTQLRNNIVSILPAESYLGPQTTPAPTGTNNEWWGAGGGLPSTSTNISGDPRFVDAGAGDFHLQASSPARQAGTAIPGLNLDFAGQVRPAGLSPDLGAYQYVPWASRRITPRH